MIKRKATLNKLLINSFVFILLFILFIPTTLAEEIEFYITDHLGSPTMVVDEQGQILETKDYKPYGKINYEDTQIDNDYGFTGKELDDTGLNYFEQRYYDSELGRFISVDPAVILLHNKYELNRITGGNTQVFLSNPQKLNSYSYVTNNPIIYVDPTGEDAKIKIDGRNHTVSIQSDIYIYGKDASQEVVQTMESNISNTWDKGWSYYDETSNTTYSINFDLKVKIAKCSVCHRLGKDNNVIGIDNDIRSYVESRGDVGLWRGDDPDPAPHEFGHLLGLDDHYSDFFGADEGWRGNIMAEAAMQGQVEQRNINTIIAPYIDKYNNRWFKPNKVRTYHLAPRGEFK